MSRPQKLKAHMSRVAGLGCILCRELGQIGTPAQLHHLREGKSMNQRGSDWTVIPICEQHHVGAIGLHVLGRSEFERRYRLSEIDLLALTIEALA